MCTVKCSVPGCEDASAIVVPLPLCAMDAVRVAAAVEQHQEGEAKMSRVQALASVKADRLSTDAELADRTGWPVQWVRSHRER
jgi:hypothetical protein